MSYPWYDRDGEVVGIEVDGRIVGRVVKRWRQDDPYSWFLQWDAIDEPACFDTLDEACMHFLGTKDDE